MPQTLSPSSHSGADVWGDELRGLAPGRETSHWPSGQHENFVSGAEKLTAIFKKHCSVAMATEGLRII